MPDYVTAFSEDEIGLLDELSVKDDSSARSALGSVLTLVGGINDELSRAESSTGVDADERRGVGLPSLGDLLKRLERWIQRLVEKLTVIVKNLADAASFSITVGTSVSVSVNFQPS